jgi:hypothetical protein
MSVLVLSLLAFASPNPILHSRERPISPDIRGIVKARELFKEATLVLLVDNAYTRNATDEEKVPHSSTTREFSLGSV